MSLTINAKIFTADSFGVNAVGYLGPAHTLTLKDDVRLGRTAPKPTAVFSGVGRTSAKLTRTLTLTAALTTTGDCICDISVSMPVGAASADIDSILNDMGSFLSSASFKTHVKGQQISF
uniref:Coat protein n=1 Tax=Leviviridae sp. TaxID=2027243 RepID=A0A514D7I0_9VIRU|nr:MAG: hypothetical protein H4Bulk462432_000002 [Leviviridae sp.]